MYLYAPAGAASEKPPGIAERPVAPDTATELPASRTEDLYQFDRVAIITSTVCITVESPF